MDDEDFHPSVYRSQKEQEDLAALAQLEAQFNPASSRHHPAPAVDYARPWQPGDPLPRRTARDFLIDMAAEFPKVVAVMSLLVLSTLAFMTVLMILFRIVVWAWGIE